eukprot:640827-Prymnesium_polylepis.4
MLSWYRLAPRAGRPFGGTRGYHHLAINPRQWPRTTVCAQRLVDVAEAMAPDDASVLGRPISIDTRWGQVRRREAMHLLAEWLRAKDAKTKGVKALLLKQLLRVWPRH